ncbi:FYN-binding protein 1-like isoform X2 [Ambystoma mexicanum]
MSTGSGPLNLSSSSCDEREEYDDVETVRPVIKRPAFSPSPPSKPKPLPSPKKDYFYDDVGSTETVFPPPPPELSKSQELRTNWKNLIMQQREAEEKEFRKKFKFDGEIKILTRMMVDPNAIIKKCGTYDLPHKRGDFLDVIQFSNPKDKMLCRNITWKFGYVPKRSLLSIEKDIYDDVGIFEELYDDIELISKVLPTVPPKVRLSSESDLSPLSKEKNLKKLKKEEKEEKDIKKKFKLEGEIKVLTQMMVDPNAKIKKGGGKYLSHKRGEILDVIERTSLEKMLCRNSKGKYGYVPRLYLLQVERQVYEYVDVSACV